MAIKYRKKPVVIEAVKLDNTKESIVEAIKFAFGEYLEQEYADIAYDIVNVNGGLYIETLEGTLKADFGDYIIRGVKNEVYPCKSDVFEITYELVEE